MMEALDFSILTLTAVLASAIVTYYYRAILFLKIYGSEIEGFAVIDIVRTLKKACPIQFSNKWKLLSTTLGSTRCWHKNILFPGIKSCIKLYGATCAVTCSSLYASSLISDVSKWGEWEPFQSSQSPILRSFSNNDFRRDHFMLADQIAGIQRGTNVQSYIAMYRFLSPPSKSTKWILFWNAKKFEFMFFLIQPVLISEDVDNQCIITHIYGSSKPSSHFPNLVIQRIRNLKEFLFMSQLSVKPIISSATPSSAASKSIFDKEFHNATEPTSVFLENNGCDVSNTVFKLLPVYRSIVFLFKRLEGYDLILKKVYLKKIRKKEMLINEKESFEPLRRTVSEIITTKTYKNFCINSVQHKSEDDIAKVTMDLKKSHNKINSKDKELSKNDQENNKKSKDSPASIKARRFSEPHVINPALSKSLPYDSNLINEEENFKNLETISETEESTQIMDNHKKEVYCTSTSEFEVIESNQQYIATMIADYLTQGNYGASVLQTEMMFANQFDNTVNLKNRVAGGWIHSSTYKGIPVLTKSICGKIMKISSFLCQIELPINCNDVWKCVKNPRFRFFSDETVKTVEILDKISESQRLIHVYHEVGGVLKRETIDFCLLQTEREEQDHFYSVFQSIEHDKCPFMHSVVRGVLKPSGWIIQNVSPKSTKITYLVQIYVSSPDSLLIQELSSIVPHSLHQLKQYLTTRPK